MVFPNTLSKLNFDRDFTLRDLIKQQELRQEIISLVDKTIEKKSGQQNLTNLDLESYGFRVNIQPIKQFPRAEEVSGFRLAF